MKERRKIVIAGSLWMGVQYAASRQKDPGSQRAAKMQITNPAKASLNARKSWEKLLLLIACNFGQGDLHVALTYRDGNLPRTRDEADRRLSAFLRKLRAERRAAGHTIKYIRVTEGFHTGGRFHHHLILNGTGQDYETVRRLWRVNGDDIEFRPVSKEQYVELARYLTKEPREKGRIREGERTWRASVGLQRPRTETCFVNDTEKLETPPGASIIDRTECQNGYGRFCTITALL